MNFIRTDAVLAIDDKPHGHEPLVERNGGILKNRSGFRGELPLLVSTRALLPTLSQGTRRNEEALGFTIQGRRMSYRVHHFTPERNGSRGGRRPDGSAIRGRNTAEVWV